MIDLDISAAVRSMNCMIEDAVRKEAAELVEKAFEDIKSKLQQKAIEYAISFSLVVNRELNNSMSLTLRFPDE